MPRKLLQTRAVPMAALAIALLFPVTGSLAGDALKEQTAPASAGNVPLVYMVRYRPGPSYRQDRALMKQDLARHGAYMRAQSDAGIIIAAGPTFDEVGGLVLIRAATRDQAWAFTKDDPAVQDGIFVAEVSSWRPGIDKDGIFRRPAPAQAAQ